MRKLFVILILAMMLIPMLPIAKAGEVASQPVFDWAKYFDEIVVWKLESGTLTLSDANADLSVVKTAITGGYQYVPTIKATKTANYMLSLQFTIPVEVIDKNSTSITYYDPKNDKTFVYDYSDTIQTLPQYEKVVTKEGMWSISITNVKLGDSVVVDPSVVGTTTATYGVMQPAQRKTFYAVSRHWVFYFDGSNFVYRTSTDGSAWSGSTTLKSSTYYSSVWWDGTYIHYVSGAGSSIYYRRGQCNNDGTITWSDAEQTIATTYNKAYSPYVCVDTNGCAWIAYLDYTGSGFEQYIVKNDFTNGTWSTSAGFPYLPTIFAVSYASYAPTVVPLSGGKVYYLYNYGIIRGRLYNAGWGAEQSPLDSMSQPYFSVTTDSSDNIYLAWLEQTSCDIHFKKWTNTWGTERTIKSSADSYSAPILSNTTTAYGTTIFCFWATSVDNKPVGALTNHIYYQYTTDSGVTWSSATDWINEADGGVNSLDMSGSFSAYGKIMGFVYRSKSASPYDINYAYLDFPTVTTVSTDILTTTQTTVTTSITTTTYKSPSATTTSVSSSQTTTKTTLTSVNWSEVNIQVQSIISINYFNYLFFKDIAISVGSVVGISQQIIGYIPFIILLVVASVLRKVDLKGGKVDADKIWKIAVVMCIIVAIILIASQAGII